MLASGSVAGISARCLSVRQQYGASDGFGGLGSEALPSRVRLVGVSARGLSVRDGSTVPATGSSRRHIGTRSCQQVGVAVRCKRRGRSRELCSIWQVNLGSSALPSRVRVAGVSARQVIRFIS